jgi:hypothetical protein
LSVTAIGRETDKDMASMKQRTLDHS